MHRKVSVSFDRKAFSVESLQKAAYRFINKFSVDFEIGDVKINCSLKFDSNVTDDQVEKLESDFKKEALDQELRLLISKETEVVRNLILSTTFLNTDLRAIE